MRRTIILIIALASMAVGPGRAQQGTPDQTVTVETTSGRIEAQLKLPATPARPPVAFLTQATDGGQLAARLASEGIATLRLDAGGTPLAKFSADMAAQLVTWLRNDERFTTVTVVAESEAAIVGARAARADGIMTRGKSAAAEPELARVIATVGTLAGGPPEQEAQAIAKFAKSVPVLGRRGSTPTRPAGGRRSPRHTIIAMVGAARVGIEWGAPQKRGRDIWGSLVKWNEIWMPGADEATTITTNAPIQIGTLTVPAGDHTFYAFPTDGKFELIVSNDTGQFHTVHDESKFLGRVEMTLTTRPDSVEGVTYAIESRGSDSVLKLIWDTREYAVIIRRPEL